MSWITSRTTCRRELSGEDVQDRAKWRRFIRNIDHIKVGKDAEEEKYYYDCYYLLLAVGTTERLRREVEQLIGLEIGERLHTTWTEERGTTRRVSLNHLNLLTHVVQLELTG